MYFKPVVRKKNKTKTGLEGNDFKERAKSNGENEEDGDDEKEIHECEECHEKFNHSR